LIAENAVYVWTQHQNREKNLRFQKYPHTCGWGLSYVIDIFKDETVKAVTEEQKKAIFSVLSGRDTFVCLQTTVSL
jgi:hypothetical protein